MKPARFESIQSVEVIPVIDLMEGLAVHARCGRRERYRPISTPLCRHADPRAVIEALLAVYPFRTLYIADLDALMQRGTQRQLIAGLAQTYPELTLWVDQGLPNGVLAFAEQRNWITVVGSESMIPTTVPLLESAEWPLILSLDYLDGQMLGPQNVIAQPAVWPDTVIVMNLSRVGSHSGPDLPQLTWFIRNWPEKRWVAAGGVRHEQDLMRLKSAGVGAVLLASALHNGQIDARVLSRCLP